jgi:arylsulfatase A-like enzyme
MSFGYRRDRGPGGSLSGVAVVVGVVFVLLLPGGCAPRTAPGEEVKHVVFISLDTTRADHFGFYGNPTVKTPNLDRLASEAIVLDDFMTVVLTTLASHTSLFTGKYPHSHGTPRNGFLVNEENVMLTELLRERGFHTAGFIGAYPLVRQFGFAQGFDHYDDSFELRTGADGVLRVERSAADVTDAVIEYLDQRDDPDNLFLFAHYFDPHYPYAPPAPYDTLYDPRGREGLPPWLELLELCKRGDDSEDVRRTPLQYAGEISFMDHQIGRLLDALRERGILDEALLVITSDHGEHFTGRRFSVCFDHGWMPYQNEQRAVGLVRLPGARHAGIRITEPVANIDILPSVLAYLGIEPPPGVEGRPIDLDGAEAPSRQDRFSQAARPHANVETDPQWANLLKARSMRRGAYKLIQVPYLQQEELYDLARDPQETQNLLAEPSPEVRGIAEQMRGELESWAASANPLPSHFVASMKDEVLRRLQALGYAGGSPQDAVPGPQSGSKVDDPTTPPRPFNARNGK